MPQLSVIMPVYNAAMYLREAIDSVLNQTFTDFEFFIIDDASTDDSVTLIKSYTDNRIILIQKPINTGYTDSLNSTIPLCKGKYIARMDADDVCVAERFLVQYNYLEANANVLVLGTNYDIIGNPNLVPNVPINGNEVKLFALTQSPVAHPSVMMRTLIFTQHKLTYNKAFEPAEDYDLWARVLELGAIENLPQVLLHYRIHASQVSQTQNVKQLNAANSIRLRQLQQLISINELEVNIDFVLQIITKQNRTVSSTELRNIKTMIAQLYTANLQKNIYDTDLFYTFLQDIWHTYMYRINAYNKKDFGLLLNNNATPMCATSLIFTAKYMLKTLVK
jgi:glycosyltransferase involved in cell wall biosynthesis